MSLAVTLFRKEDKTEELAFHDAIKDKIKHFKI